MIYIKKFSNVIQSIPIKIDNMMFIFIKRKFVNILAKNTI